MKVVRLTLSDTSFEANLIKGRLESEGVPCFLANENITTLLPHFNRMLGGGVQIMVFERDLEKASEILGLNKE
jgi:hypothetical protein